MKARHLRYLVIVLFMSSLAFLFNNCAQPEEEKTVPSEAEVVLATEIVGKLTAKLEFVGSDGTAYGYALDSGNKASILKVLFYAGGPVGTGVFIGETAAKIKSAGTYAGHFFSFQIPASHTTGTTQKLFVYAHKAEAKYLVAPGEFSFVSYIPKAEEYFNQNVAPHLGACTRCHDWTIRHLFYGPLLTPSPLAGGSQTNNRFFRKMSGLEGHNGGNFCTGGTNTGFCSVIQAWWRAEFQP